MEHYKVTDLKYIGKKDDREFVSCTLLQMKTVRKGLLGKQVATTRFEDIRLFRHVTGLRDWDEDAEWIIISVGELFGKMLDSSQREVVNQFIVDIQYDDACHKAKNTLEQLLYERNK